MASPYLPPLPADTITGVAVLSCVVAGVRTSWASRGGVTFETEEEFMNPGEQIDGTGGMAIADLDVVVGLVARVRGDFVEVSAARLAELDHLTATPAAVAGVQTIQRPAANQMLADAQAVSDVWLDFPRGDGGAVRVVFDRAMNVTYAVAGEDRGVGTVSLALEAREVLP